MVSQKRKLKSVFPLLFMLIGLFLIIGCNKESRGFALPAGDVEEGKATFVNLGCNECHRVSDIPWIGNAEGLNIHLGGEVSQIKTYGELVTSVINPSHKIGYSYLQEVADAEGKSKMRVYNEVMTVQQLVDVVTFLQSEYKIVRPQMDYYPYN